MEQKVCTAWRETECWTGRLAYGSGRVSQVKLRDLDFFLRHDFPGRKMEAAVPAFHPFSREGIVHVRRRILSSGIWGQRDCKLSRNIKETGLLVSECLL